MLENEFKPKSHNLFGTVCRIDTGNDTGILMYVEPEIIKKKGSNFEEIHLRPNQRIIDCPEFTPVCSLEITKDKIRDLSNVTGLQANEILGMLTETLLNEEKNIRVNQIVDIYEKKGLDHANFKLNKWQRFLGSIFKNLTFPEYVERSNKVGHKLIFFSNIIQQATRERPADFCIIGKNIIPFVYDSKLFVFDPNADTSSDISSGVVRVGKIATFDIYLNLKSDFDPDTIVIGQKSRNPKSGVYWVTRDRVVQSVENGMTGSQTFTIKERTFLDSVGDTAKFKFYTTKIKLGKKPLWRKILFI